MRIVGITAEYNPFHKGHLYHLERSVELSGADYSVAVMSGNFTQRGEPALMDKWTRSRAAVDAGLDLVVELPFVRACSMGRSFAAGAVDILAGLGATHISFGSESGDVEELKYTAEALMKGEKEIKKAAGEFMSRGNSYAKSFYEAACLIIGREEAAVMSEPNNILALEYLRRIAYINERGGNIKALTVKRKGSGYFEEKSDTGFAGGGAIRSMAAGGRLKEAEKYVPEGMRHYLADRLCGDADENMFRLLRYEIVRSSAEELSGMRFVGEGMEHRLKREAVRAGSMGELINSMVSRRYTASAIRRALVSVLLGIKKEDEVFSPYGRVLAAGGRGRELLRIMKKDETASIPVVTNVNRREGLCDEARACLEADIHASDIYNLISGRDLYRCSDRVITPYIEK